MESSPVFSASEVDTSEASASGVESGRSSGEGAITIVVTGFPKSGNTWLSHLVADAVGCPMEGFWGSGAGRVKPDNLRTIFSPHRVFKAHHLPQDIGLGDDSDPSLKVIHVVRDPRDVVCSGAAYFRSKLLHFYISHPDQRHADVLETMACAVLHGTDVYPCCGRPWSDFNRLFLRNDVLTVRYEDLLADPNSCLERILSFLGLRRDPQQLLDAIHRQSFEVARQRAVARGHKGMLSLLRKGQAGDYREQLSATLISRIESGCGKMMDAFGYSPDFVEDPEVVAALSGLKLVPAPVEMLRVGEQATDYCLVPEDLSNISHWLSTPTLRPSEAFARCLREEYQIEPVAEPPERDFILHCDLVGFRPELLARARIVVLNLDELASCLDSRAFSQDVAPVLRALAQSHDCVHLRCHRIGSPLAVPGFNASVPSALQATFLRRDRWCRGDRRHPPALPHPLELVLDRGAHPQMILDRNWCPGVPQSPESLCTEQAYRISSLRTILKMQPSPTAPRKRPVAQPPVVGVASDLVLEWIYEQCLTLGGRVWSRLAEEPALEQSPSEPLRELASGKTFRLSAAYKGFPREGVVLESDPFFFHTSVMPVPSITVDLEAEHALHRLVVENRSDMWFERSRFLFCVVHQEEQFLPQEGVPLQGTGKAFGSAGSTPSETDLHGVRGRYLTLFSPETTALHLRAIRVYGT